MKKGEVLRIKIENLAPDGCGLAEVEGRSMLVNGALPGDVISVWVAGLKRHSARVRLESIVVEGVKRTAAKCTHFSQCGGCRWQDVPYDVQCKLKAKIVRESIGQIYGIEPIDDIDIVPSPDIFFYRNKMEFSFDRRPKEEKLQLGLHESGRYDRVFDVSRCFLQSDISNRIIEVTRNFALEHGLSAYGLKSHVGLLRFLMIRDGKNTGDVMVNLVTSVEEFRQERTFCDYLLNEIPEVTTVIRSINKRTGSVSTGEEREVLSGDGLLKDRIGKFMFEISPDSFFQTNIHQAEKLYDTISEFSNLTGTENLLDLYCGTGTIGIYLAEKVGKVTGVEMVDEAVSDARRNAEINGINNITFISGQAEKTISESMGKFDVVVCDPPRAGIQPGVMRHLVRMRIPRMIYVSCNVRAIPGDLEMLLLAGYLIKKIRVFDMSPHTPHIETVLLLEIE
ncbi:MAG TPA: 23S rRNA (uracil(1939)-C(5))-methyltransferase RlmD [Anaerolineae bacterium]|nr:23S rRNA (uracil(1939)-C(5))-methyltransferase RlmD [Anaerolineae bacterium]